MEKMISLMEAAQYASIAPKTLKRWIREAGYKLPGKRKTLIPERLLQRLIDERTPRLARG